MKNFSLTMFNVIALILIVVCAIFAVHPFKSVDMEQAKRIAKWKMQYDQFLYCFSLVLQEYS